MILKRIIDWYWGPKTSPQSGGCWFCNRPKGTMFLSREFDAYYHIQCLEKALRDPGDIEARIIGREFT